MISSYNSLDNKWEEVMAYAMSNHVIDTVQYIENSGTPSPNLLYEIAVLFAKKIHQNPLCHSKYYEMFQHVHSTANFVKVSFNKLRGTINLELIPLGLTECCCFDSAFHRIKSPRRNILDKAIVNRLAESFPDKNQQVRLLSMGSGGLMGDFILLEKLILSGFKKITIDCVEPLGIEEESIEKLLTFFNEIPEVSINLEAFKDIEDVPSDREFAAVLAIDYSELAKITSPETIKNTADLMKAYGRLSETGFLGLGFCQDEDNLFGRKMKPVPLNSPPSTSYRIARDVMKLLQKKKELVFTVPNLHAENLSHNAMLCISLAAKSSSLPLEKVSLFCKDTLKYDLDVSILPDFNNMMDVLFTNIQTEVILGDQPVTKEPDINFII